MKRFVLECYPQFIRDEKLYEVSERQKDPRLGKVVFSTFKRDIQHDMLYINSNCVIDEADSVYDLLQRHPDLFIAAL